MSQGKGANVILGPSVNVHRVAQNGRNFEYLSGEDPHLGYRLTSAYVRAVQAIHPHDPHAIFGSMSCRCIQVFVMSEFNL